MSATTAMPSGESSFRKSPSFQKILPETSNIYRQSYARFVPSGRQQTMKNTFKRLSAFSVILLALVSASPSAQATAGQLYSGGLNTHAVYRFSSSGVQSTFVNGPDADSIGFDSKGNLFVSDPTNKVLVKITPGGTKTNFDSGYAPAGLAFDAAGNLFVADATFGNIYKYLPDKTRTTFASGVSGPFGLAFDRAGNLYVSEFNTNSILKFAPNGTQSATPFASGLHGPLGLAFNSAGNLFEVDFSTGRINKISPTGVVTVFAASLSAPRHLAFDRNGNLFASDFGTQRILEFPPNFAVGNMPIAFASSTTAAGLAFEPPTAQLANISTRAFVQTGARVTIAGFIVTGTDPKRVVLRGLGPTLSQPPFNVTGVLADPTLELHDSTHTNPIATNDNWKDVPAQQAAIQATGLAPQFNAESAIVLTLQPGNYTVILAGKNGTTGVGLVEVYDVNTGAFAELTNVSTRGFVGTGDNVMIGGIITGGGNGSTVVVVRGLGPTLSQPPFNLTGVLADPVLRLVNSNGTVIYSNNNWKDTQPAAIQATGLAPPNDLESAIIITLAAGNYTAILSGNGGGTGIGLVEVYKLR
jgi:sugar lactone lactonase YvrE